MELSDAMQQQAKALADPSRFRLFRHIVEAPQPVGVAELTELLGFNHNAIRQHLAVLLEASLVIEEDEQRSVRGRPRKLYSPRADALNAFGSVSGSYERLADLLLQLVGADVDAYEVGYRSAAAQPIEATADPAQVNADLLRRLALDGFEPSSKAGATELANCPFADVAAKDPGVVCELHRGLIDGYLSAQRPHLRSDLVLRDPHAGGCRVKVELADSGDVADSATDR